MTARVMRYGPSERNSHDYAAILLVTDRAAGIVCKLLVGALQITELGGGSFDVPRYRVAALSRDGNPRRPAGALLTVREREVLSWAALGRSNAEIGSELYISTETVRTHMAHVLRKVGAVNRANAVHIAHLRGLLFRMEGGQ